MRVTVFGSSGLLGQALTTALRGETLTALSSKNVDLRDESGVQEAIRAARPDWIILAAAYTDVDGCESDRERAFSVNTQGAANVARAARGLGARLMFLSTDYVFDGESRLPYETTHRRNPINIYGTSKAQAEEKLLEILPNVCIVRTSWLFGVGGKCFPATILKLAAGQSEIPVVHDQLGCPTFTADLASTLLQLCQKSASGIVHATNAGSCTWYEFARKIVRVSRLPAKVKPVSSIDFPRPARRPAFSILSPVSLRDYGISMPGWQDALRRYLAAYPTQA